MQDVTKLVKELRSEVPFEVMSTEGESVSLIMMTSDLRDQLADALEKLDNANEANCALVSKTMEYVADLTAERDALRQALKSIPFSEYGGAFAEGCDAAGAWGCFCEAAYRHINDALAPAKAEEEGHG